MLQEVILTGMSDASPNAEPAAAATTSGLAVPPRFWWLKRVLIAVAVVLVVVGVSRWWWGVYAWGALHAEIDRLRAAGEPMDAADSDLPPVPDERNAAIPLKEAAEIHARLSSPASLGSTTQPANTVPVDIEVEDERLAAVARIRELVREARLRPEVNWGYRNRSFKNLPPNLMPLYRVADTLHDVATKQIEGGDHAGALDTLEDLLALGDRVDAYRMLLAEFLNHAISEWVAELVEKAMRSYPAISWEDTFGTIEPARLRGFIHQLLDDRSLCEGMVWGFRCERFVQLDVLMLLLDGCYSESASMGPGLPRVGALWAFLLRPMFMLDGLRVLCFNTTSTESAKASSWPEAISRHAYEPFEVRPGLWLDSRSLSAMLMPDFTSSIKRAFEVRSQRRMAAVALTLRVYEAEHGRLPETLQELVPNYLPHVPQNPLAEDGQLVQYSPESLHPHLYCRPPDEPSADECSPSGQRQVKKAGPLRFYLCGKPAPGASGSATRAADQP